MSTARDRHQQGAWRGYETRQEMAAMTELEELRAEVRSYQEAFTAMQYAKEVERFHILDGLKDDLCPACGSPVKTIEGPEYPGERSAHGTEISQTTVRLKPRYGRVA